MSFREHDCSEATLSSLQTDCSVSAFLRSFDGCVVSCQGDAELGSIKASLASTSAQQNVVIRVKGWAPDDMHSIPVRMFEDRLARELEEPLP
eukprot:5755963-Pyramimonas_sp.AAC.1